MTEISVQRCNMTLSGPWVFVEVFKGIQIQPATIGVSTYQEVGGIVYFQDIGIVAKSIPRY